MTHARSRIPRLVAPAAVACACLGALICLSGCAVATIDVDVYKGPLANDDHIQTQQAAALAMGAKPLLITLRDRLEWFSPWRRDYHERVRDIDRSDKDRRWPNLYPRDRAYPAWYKEGYVQPDPKTKRSRFKRDQANRVNEILGLYEDRCLDPYLAYVLSEGDRLLQAYETAKAILLPHASTDREYWEEVLRRFKQGTPSGLLRSDKDTREAILGAYRLLLYPDPNGKTKGVRYAPETIRLQWERMRAGDSFGKALTDLATTQRLLESARGVSWDKANERFLALQDRSLVQKHAEMLFPGKTHGVLTFRAQFVQRVCRIADSFVGARTALAQMIDMGLKLVLWINNPDNASRLPNPQSPELVTEAVGKLLEGTFRHGLDKRVRGASQGATLPGQAAASALQMEGFPDAILGKGSFAAWLAECPGKRAELLLEWHKELRGSATRQPGQADGLFGLAGGPSRDITELGQAMAAFLGLVRRGLGMLSEGRLAQGLNSLTEEYLEAQASRGGEDPVTRRAREILQDALARFAQKVLFLANNEPILQSGHNRGGLVPMLAKAAYDATINPDIDAASYGQVLQALGNSILLQVDALHKKAHHDMRITGQVNAELAAVHAALAKSPEDVLDELRDSLDSDAEGRRQSRKALETRCTQLNTDIAARRLEEGVLTKQVGAAATALKVPKSEVEKWAQSVEALATTLKVMDKHGAAVRLALLKGNPLSGEQMAGLVAEKLGNMRVQDQGLSLDADRKKGLADEKDVANEGEERAREKNDLGKAEGYFRLIKSRVRIDTGPRGTVFDALIKAIRDAVPRYGKELETARSALGQATATHEAAKEALQAKTNQREQREQERVAALKRIADLTGEIAILNAASKAIRDHRVAAIAAARQLVARPPSVVAALLIKEYESAQLPPTTQPTPGPVPGQKKQATAGATSQPGTSPAKPPAGPSAFKKAVLATLRDRVPMDPIGLDRDDLPANPTAKDALDAMIALLRHEHIQEVRRGGADGERAKRLKEALDVAYEQRAGMIFLRPAASYLRTSYPATSLQPNASLGWQNMTARHGLRQLPFAEFFMGANRNLKTLQEIDKQFWQNINRVRVAGGGDTNYVIAKDDVGNWYVKNYSAKPDRIINSAKNLALFGLSGAMQHPVGGVTGFSRKPGEEGQLTGDPALVRQYERLTKKYRDGARALLTKAKETARNAPSDIEQAWSTTDYELEDVEAELVKPLRAERDKSIKDLAGLDVKGVEDKDVPAELVKALAALKSFHDDVVRRIDDDSLPNETADQQKIVKGRKRAAAVVTKIVLEGALQGLVAGAQKGVTDYANGVEFIGQTLKP